MRKLTRAQVIKILKRQQGKLSLRQFAKEIGISAAYLSDLYLGRRDPGDTVLQKFGMWKSVTRTVVYGQVGGRS